MTLPLRMPTTERQAEIVAAVLGLASETSPTLITTGHIAAAIGVTQGAVFKHFPTKDAIWLAALQWVRQQLLQALEAAAAAAEGAPMQALGAMFRAHVDFVVAHAGVPRIIFHELQQPDDSPAKQEVRALLKAYRRLLLAVLADAVRRGEVPDDLDREAAATMFVGSIQGLVMQSMLGGKLGAMRREADRVLALLLHGLGQPR